ncbi:MAG: hypothetical protein IKU98_02325 [Bacteroidaceae bacterium]|nr:hypothetical protein [Bacteroidaceae bacterium]
MKKLINSILLALVLVVGLVSCEDDPIIVPEEDLTEVKIAVVLPKKDRKEIWDNTLKLAEKNIKDANIGIKVVYEWYDEETSDLSELGKTLSDR